ncbi:MAG TPA: Rieske 2Fe-2S domain-containing protein [Casimicrobiaceae bacterium]|jgi:nitrite reductase/ring-hydroxylating ferredoxin subunit
MIMIEVGKLRDLVARRPTVVAVPHSAVAIFQVAERMHGIDEACMRCGSSLASGKLTRSSVACSRCGWTYDVVTGFVNGMSTLRTTVYEVTVRDSTVFVALPMDISTRDS